ncbi:TonB-dependent receptor [Sphingobium amiense]|uniref:TonB-dependent receptor n=1 Tax=Sphingobium amiense TaxID=135719 RepID=A0A494WCS3_9SPHN|nr:TonB-dependent receptor [Sphingobium amiense]
MSGISMLVVGGIAAPASAQDAPQATDNVGLQDIVVTAQKQAQNMQDVPISVAAVTAQALTDLNATTLQGLQGSVPNLQVGTNGTKSQSSVYTIRGIGIIEPDPYAGNTVSIVIDGIPQFFSMGALADIYDVERVEVLRGPQGTLFGANTTGGVVNVINTQPQKDFGGKLDVTYGNYDQFRAAGALNVPINEQLAARVVISHDQRDGYIRNVVDGRDLGRRNSTLFRGALKYSPNAGFDLTLSGEYVRARNGAPVVIQGALPGEAAYVPTGFRNQYASPCSAVGQRCKAPDKYVGAQTFGPLDANGNVVDPIKDESNLDSYRASLTLNVYDTAIGDITAITGYRSFTLLDYTDEGASTVWQADTRRRTKAWQMSQELRTAVDLTDRIKLQVGGFAMWDHYKQLGILRLNFSGPTTYDFATDTVTYSFPGLHQSSSQDQDNYSISGFAQAYFDLTDQLRLQAGIRYTHEQTSMLASTRTTLSASGITTQDGIDPATGQPNSIDFGSVAPPRGKKSWNNVGWKLGLDYKPTDDLMLYGYWARGFKSGGFVGRLSLASDLGPYDPEYVDTFEVGVKADLFDRRLRANLTGFYTDYRDMQLSQIYFINDPVTGSTVGSTIINAASSHIKGIEAELTAVPVTGLTLSAALAYLDAKYADFQYQLGTGGSIDMKGERLQNAPKWSSSVDASYEFPIGDMTGRLHAQYNYQSEKLLANIIDAPRARIQPQHIVNANIDLEINDHFRVGLYATNLLNKHYISVASDFVGVLAPLSYAPPRMYGISAGYKF